MKRHLEIGCTVARHLALGVNAVVNARAGLQVLNDLSIEEIELARDAQRIRGRINNRVRFYQFNSKFFRRHLDRVKHLLSDPSD